MSNSTESAGPVSRILARVDERPMPFAAIGFCAGAVAGSLLPLGPGTDRAVSFLATAYDKVAPPIIFLTLAPSIVKLLRSDRPAGLRFTAQTIAWFCELRLLASLVGVAFAALLFGLPLTRGGAGASLTHSIATGGRQFAANAIRSPYIIAFVLAIAVALLVHNRTWRWVHAFAAVPDLVERIGSGMTRITPLFTFAVGVYVMALPAILSTYLARHPATARASVRIAGVSIAATSPGGMLAVYLVVALATGLVCAIWQSLLLARVRAVIPGFSLRVYFGQYLSRIYPLIWATCSESLGTPVNLHLMRRLYPFVDSSVRQFAVALGSTININGTILCCFVLTPAVCALIGQPISVTALLLTIPLIFLIGFGVPGIPGELLLFAGPIASVLQVPPALLPAFIALFVTLQFGLPDSFRSSGNSTDTCPATLLIDARWRAERGKSG